jgi:hypothetical protein
MYLIKYKGCKVEKHLSTHEKQYDFLNLSYNRFFDLYEAIMSDEFWELSSELRLYKTKEIFSIYFELLAYEPIKEFIKALKVIRPPMEAELSNDFLKFIRNTLIHFPFFTSWENIYISNNLINWNSEGKTIDRFLKKYLNHKEVKYRFWDNKRKIITYLVITFPIKYNGNEKLYLKDFITEKDGIKISIILMNKVLMSQVLKIKEK